MPKKICFPDTTDAVPWYDYNTHMGNNIEAAMTNQDEMGTVEELIAVVSAELGHPPGGCGRAMALVVGENGADHLGLLSSGSVVLGGLSLLSSAVTARTRPRAALLLEWVCDGTPQRRYLGWAVERHTAQVSWRRLRTEELRAVIDPRTRRALGETAGIGFEGWAEEEPQDGHETS